MLMAGLRAGRLSALFVTRLPGIRHIRPRLTRPMQIYRRPKRLQFSSSDVRYFALSLLRIMQPYTAMEKRMFENPEIAIENLPGTDNVRWKELDPAYKRLRQIQSALALMLVALPLMFITIAADIPVVPAAVVWSAWTIVLAILLTWPTIALPKRGYVIRDKDMLFRKGVIWRSVTAVPFNRIQHVETSNTPLDRKFDLATLQLFTAGGSSGDLKIDGLSASVAEQLRIFILAKVGTSIEHDE